jgi:hypothetical protein
MATFVKFNSFVEALAEKVHNLGADTLTVARAKQLSLNGWQRPAKKPKSS